jgi:GMP synthase (glutamine-hydrolysing)
MAAEMTGLLVLRHDLLAPPGLLGEAIAAAGIPSVTVDPGAGDPLPDPGRWAGVVSLGGFMGAYEEDAHPWLAGEKQLLAAAVADGIPVLGICLGCQILADALGGRAYLAPAVEAGLLRLRLTGRGAADPVLGRLGGAVPVWHRDTWDLPPGGELLAESDRYPHAFRYGPAVGIQAHPEATVDIVAGWMAAGGVDELRSTGVDPDGFLEAIAANEAEQRSTAAAVFAAWLEEVAVREAR